jgi:hypothetical protein
MLIHNILFTVIYDITKADELCGDAIGIVHDGPTCVRAPAECASKPYVLYVFNEIENDVTRWTYYHSSTDISSGVYCSGSIILSAPSTVCILPAANLSYTFTAWRGLT